MPSYHQRLTEFSEKKRLQRLPDSIRDPSNPFCDACGSTQPRTLYGLTDIESKRHYFVGDSCLKELVKQGSVLRKFGKQSGKQAYDEEMQLRTGPADNSSGVDGLRVVLARLTIRYPRPSDPGSVARCQRMAPPSLRKYSCLRPRRTTSASWS